MTADIITIHDDELHREPVERVDALCDGWWNEFRGGRPDNVLPRTTVWNVAGQAFVVLRDTGLCVVHYAPGPDDAELTVVFTRIPPASRPRFGGADVVVSWPEVGVSAAVGLAADFDPPRVGDLMAMTPAVAVPFAEFLTTLGACPQAFVYAGTLDAMPG